VRAGKTAPLFTKEAKAMKKLWILLAAVLLSFPSLLMAAGSCTQTPYTYAPGSAVVIKLVCTGDIAGGTVGTIPTQTITTANMAHILGVYYFYQAKAYPTSGGTAPDAADVAVLMDGQDMLGAKGVNLIHATATYDTFPYSTFMSSYRYPMITNTITVTVANQATASANWTIELLFVR
jgi:hypothetical protein